MRGTSLVPRDDVIAARSDDTDGPAVGRGRWLAVDRLRDHQPTTLVGIDQPPSLIHLAGLAAESGERRIVEGPCPLQVIAADNDVWTCVAPEMASWVSPSRAWRRVGGCPPR